VNRALYAVIGLGLLPLGCEDSWQPGQFVPAEPGPSRVLETGERMSADDACARLRDAFAFQAESVGCPSVFDCGSELRAFNTCGSVDRGTVEACVTRIERALTCQALEDPDCSVAVLPPFRPCVPVNVGGEGGSGNVGGAGAAGAGASGAPAAAEGGAAGEASSGGAAGSFAGGAPSGAGAGDR
jgi:hypothetical protein